MVHRAEWRRCCPAHLQSAAISAVPPYSSMPTALSSWRRSRPDRDQQRLVAGTPPFGITPARIVRHAAVQSRAIKHSQSRRISDRRARVCRARGRQVRTNQRRSSSTRRRGLICTKKNKEIGDEDSNKWGQHVSESNMKSRPGLPLSHCAKQL